jgi:hypothetical protein
MGDVKPSMTRKIHTSAATLAMTRRDEQAGEEPAPQPLHHDGDPRNFTRAATRP